MNKIIFTPKHEFILHVYSPQKLAINPIMDNYAQPVITKADPVFDHKTARIL